MRKSSKTALYLSLGSLVPLLISLMFIPIFSFSMRLSIIIVIPIYILLMFFAVWHIKKDLVHYSVRAGKITARSVLTIMTITPIGSLIAIFFYYPDFTGIDFVVFIIWGVSSIIDIIAAIIYKVPKKSQQKTIF